VQFLRFDPVVAPEFFMPSQSLTGHQAALRAAKRAFKVGDFEAERRLLQSLDPALLSDAQFVRLVELQLNGGAGKDVEKTAGLVNRRTFESERGLLRTALLLTSAQRPDLACALLYQTIQPPAPPTTLVVYWASLVLDRLERPQDVIAVLDTAAGASWERWVQALVRGKVHAALNETEPALLQLQQAAALAPEKSIAWFELAVLQRRLGLTDAYTTSLRRAITLDPDNVTAHRLLGYEHRYQAGDQLLIELLRLRQHSSAFLIVTQVELDYALAKAYEDIGDLDQAFEHYASAGKLQRSVSPWNFQHQQRLNARLMEPATTDWIRSASASAAPDERPVFIVGMPRSGTTLVEQMIASHPDAFGAGELKSIERLLHGLKIGSFTLMTMRPHDGPSRIMALPATAHARGEAYLAELQTLAPSASRVLDKMPGNFQWVGLVSALLPHARFIHCRRHPLDTCLSQYRLYFGAEVPYSYDLRDIGRAYRAYDELMRHWATIVPPERLIAIRYEDLVRDFERHARELVAYCGLPWNAACLDYAKAPRQVRTASASQVRAAPHTSAIGRWRRYESFLTPLIDEIGDLVESYQRELEQKSLVRTSSSEIQ
jgi:tetratricopeptide (TPR) repeat protein